MNKIKIMFLCLLFSTTMLMNCHVSQDTTYAFKISECKPQKMENIVGNVERKNAQINEELIWTYDAVNKKLNIVHTNMNSNCNMDFLAEIDYNYNTKTYEIVEKNVSTTMARCLCFYDATYTIDDVESGNITIDISGEKNEFTTVMDLRGNSGTVTIEEDVTLY